MKYYVSYPIYIDCNLWCDYCWFTRSQHVTGDIGTIGITVEQWNCWRDTHLRDAEEILVEFTGGEPFVPQNVAVMRMFMDGTSAEQLDMLTNGIQPWCVYESFVKDYGPRIKRIGMSYHRMAMSRQQDTLFRKNAARLRDLGVSVYIKELLAPQVYWDVLKARTGWEQEGFAVKWQDYKMPRDMYHSVTGESFGVAVMDQEYVRTVGHPCFCRYGYKTIIIHSKWKAGDVIACWFNQVVVGNIVENTYNPDAVVIKEANGMQVQGVPLVYNDQYIKQERSRRIEKSWAM